MRSRSVFNFFLPDHPLPGDVSGTLVAPEMQILTEANVGATNNALFTQVYIFNNQSTVGSNTVTRINIDPLTALASNSDALLDDLNVLLLGGSMPVAMRATLNAHLTAIADTPAGRTKRALDAVFLIVSSPLFMVQH